MACKSTDSNISIPDLNYRDLFRHAGYAILLLHTDNDRIFDANTHCCDLFGYSLEELAGMTIWDLHLSDEQQTARRLRAKALSNGNFRDAENIHYKRKDGSLAPVSVTTTILDAGTEKIALVQARDITDLKQSEKQREQLHNGLWPQALLSCRFERAGRGLFG